MTRSQTFDTKKYFDLISQVAKDFKKSKEYHQTIDLLMDCWRNEGKIFTMGCGGSASTATHFASDLAKTVIPRHKYKPGFKAISLVDNIPLVSAWSNDEGWGNIFSGQLKSWLTDNDVLIGFSVHGGSGSGNAGPWSQNLVSAMKLAQERDAKIIGFSGFDGGDMKKMADTCLVIPVDYEPYGTPVIEAFHVVLTHAIIFDLKERIKNE